MKQMRKFLASTLPVLALLLAFPVAGRAGTNMAPQPPQDQFSQIENSPYTYWVPTPYAYPPGYVAAPPPYYYGPGPYYYGPPVRVYVGGPHFFFGFHIR
jgi:hypothetical protein